MHVIECNDIDDGWAQLASLVKTRGHRCSPRGMPIDEILDVAMTLNKPRNSVLTNPARDLSPYYACAELIWYLSGTDETKMIEAYAPSYEKYAENGRAWGAYGHRWASDISFRLEYVEKPSLDIDAHYWGKTQLHAVISLLKRDPDTRQAVITMWNSGDLVHAALGDKKDIPCTLGMQFFIRDYKLNCITTMRSNDLWRGFPYDVYCFTAIQQMIADSLKLDVGWYTHRVGSLHVYEKERGRLYGAGSYTPDRGVYAPHKMLVSHERAAELLVGAEQAARLYGKRTMLEDLSDVGTTLYTAVAVCMHKWTKGFTYAACLPSMCDLIRRVKNANH